MAIVSQEIATIQTLFANDHIWCDKMDVNIKLNHLGTISDLKKKTVMRTDKFA